MPAVSVSTEGRTHLGAGQLPFRVRIGVTGHRSLTSHGDVAHGIAQAWSALDAWYRATSQTPVLFTVVSALAEGADRLVVDMGLAQLGPARVELEAVLPLAPAEYRETFAVPRAPEFGRLMEQAVQLHQLTDKRTHSAAKRDESFEDAGRFVVDECDALIAVWDGHPARGRGGTAQIVAYAEARGAPVIIVNAEAAAAERLTWRDGRRQDETRGAFEDLDRYNRARVSGLRSAQRASKEYARLESTGAGTVLAERLEAAASWVLPHYVRADLLADRDHRSYERIGHLIHVLSALAVTAVAGQVVFARDAPGWLGFEIGMMVLLVITLQVGRRRRLHDRWVGYRSLAEAFRSAVFIALAGIENTRDARDPQALAPTWFQRAFSDAWRHRPALDVDEHQAAALAQVIKQGWLADQIHYYRKKEHDFARSRKRYAWVISLLAAITVVVAVLHVAEIGRATWLPHAFEFLAIVLPACGAAVAGVREQGQHRFHEDRSRRAAVRLEYLTSTAHARTSLEAVRSLAAETQAILLEENANWSGVAEFQDLELVM